MWPKAIPGLADPAFLQKVTFVLGTLPPFETFHSSVKKLKLSPEAVIRYPRAEIQVLKRNARFPSLECSVSKRVYRLNMLTFTPFNRVLVSI